MKETALTREVTNSPLDNLRQTIDALMEQRPVVDEYTGERQAEFTSGTLFDPYKVVRSRDVKFSVYSLGRHYEIDEINPKDPSQDRWIHLSFIEGDKPEAHLGKPPFSDLSATDMRRLNEYLASPNLRDRQGLSAAAPKFHKMRSLLYEKRRRRAEKRLARAEVTAAALRHLKSPQ